MHNFSLHVFLLTHLPTRDYENVLVSNVYNLNDRIVPLNSPIGTWCLPWAADANIRRGLGTADSGGGAWKKEEKDFEEKTKKREKKEKSLHIKHFLG